MENVGRGCIHKDARPGIVDFHAVEFRWRQVLDRGALRDALDGDQVCGLFDIAFRTAGRLAVGFPQEARFVADCGVALGVVFERIAAHLKTPVWSGAGRSR
ncbi:hypothetical protein [Gluconobacter oxydans]|uniref:hypothetical protein n=1 Tax=Gluconobacter oxydans TaxID=442 RepID=UPI0039E95911